MPISRLGSMAESYIDSFGSVPETTRRIVDLYAGKEGWAYLARHQIPVTTLEAWRRRGDELADRVLHQLDVAPGQDTLDCIRQSRCDAANEFMDKYAQIPVWVDMQQIQRGQAVFWRYASPMLALLLHFSLIVGVSAPMVNQVLLSTGYLTKVSPRTFRRLLETTSWLVTCMETNSLEPNGPGWEATMRVRFLHAKVRQRIRNSTSWYDEEKFGVPINQEDMFATICAFSMGPAAGLRRMGLDWTAEQRRDFVALWRYIAWLMGVDDDVNSMTCFDRGAASAMSIVLHISRPDETSRQIAQALLQSCADFVHAEIMPSYTSEAWYHFLVQMTRVVVGDDYALALGLPLHEIRWQTRGGVWLLLTFYRLSSGVLSDWFDSYRIWRIQRAQHNIPAMLATLLKPNPKAETQVDTGKFLLQHVPRDPRLADELD